MSLKRDSFNWDILGLKQSTTANPAAGADPAAVTVPSGKRYLVLSAINTVTTDANVANRYPYLHIKNDGSASTAMYMAATPITASIAGQIVSFGGGAAGGAIGAGQVIAIPIPSGGVEVPAAGTIRVQYLNIQATDDAAAMTLIYKEAPA